MTDTPDHIKDLQLKIRLSEAPVERLLQFFPDNDRVIKSGKTNRLASLPFHK
jgi:hypothetical protein